MAIHVSKYSDGQLSVKIPDSAGQVVQNYYEFDITGKNLALNDIIDIGVLPAYATVADVILVCDDLDTNVSPAMTLDVGIMSGEVGTTGTRTCGEEFFSDSTIAQAGGVARMTNATGFRVAMTGADRSIGVKVTAAAATEAASGKIGVIVLLVQ